MASCIIGDELIAVSTFVHICQCFSAGSMLVGLFEVFLLLVALMLIELFKFGRGKFGNRFLTLSTYSGPFCCNRNSHCGNHLACSNHGSSYLSQFCNPPLQ